MATPRVIVLTGYGINCEEETQFAFAGAGATAKIEHINDIIAFPEKLNDAEIFVFPGGFSYGDDTGSGKALAGKIKNNLLDEFQAFIERDTLMLGICNGFQVMINLGLVPGLDGRLGRAEASLEHNDSNRYQCRWVDVAGEKKCPSIFTRGIERMHIPVAHAEGRFYAPPTVLDQLERQDLVSLRYIRPDGMAAAVEFPTNPNGSVHDIAAVCDPTGRLMGMMPHPERNILPTHSEDWTLRREHARRKDLDLPEDGDGMQIFTNAVQYFE